MPKSKTDDVQVFVKEGDQPGILEIHVTGDLLPCSAFLEILALLKAHRAGKSIIIAVYRANMMLQIRESVPSEFYARIELLSPNAPQPSGGLRRAG